jgi:hypothetical protein
MIEKLLKIFVRIFQENSMPTRGIFQKINDWFTASKEEFIPKEETPEPIKPEIKEVDTSQDYWKEFECDFCKETIQTYHKRKTFNGKKYHKECYRSLYRLARKEAQI